MMELHKGMPAPGLLAGRETGSDLNLLRGDLPLPCAVLKRSALATNRHLMADFLRRSGVQLCPHAKTTMSPALVQMQMDDGAWGITVATVQQLRVMVHFGQRRILMANQLVGRAETAEVRELMARHADLCLYVLVDSVAGVRHLDAHLRLADGVRLRVLLEVGAIGARTGVRSHSAGLEVARAVKASKALDLSGVETYEGVVQGGNDAQSEAHIGALYQRTAELARACEAADLFGPEPVILSGGGSAFVDMAAQGLADFGLRAACVLLVRSGCYLSHDVGWLERHSARMRERSPQWANLRPQAALEVWAHVQSRPEPRLAFATLGKRDVSHDIDLPRPIAWFRPGVHAQPEPLYGHGVTGLNDQHAYLSVPTDSPLQVGDLLAFGISHPCTTFDKWRLLHIVDDDYSVVDSVETYF
jgi:D-serine dehydratase